MYEFEKLLMGVRDLNILDIGCGYGGMFKFYQLDSKNLAVGVDIMESNLKTARQNNTQAFFTKSKAETLPFKDETFDLVMCQDVLEHVDDFAQSVKEAKRIIKRGGFLLISSPRPFVEYISKALDDEYFSEHMHRRIIYEKDFRAALDNFALLSKERREGLGSILWILRSLFGIKFEHQTGSISRDHTFFHLLGIAGATDTSKEFYYSLLQQKGRLSPATKLFFFLMRPVARLFSLLIPHSTYYIFKRVR